MTKSPQSATKLRLSRLVRCIIALGCLKLAIMAAALFELPMPSWGDDKATVETAMPAQPVNEITAPVQQAAQSPQPQVVDGELPQGSAAAELAAAAKPARNRVNGSAGLPVPLAPATSSRPMIAAGGAFVPPLLPQPPALGAPLARAGVIMPQKQAEPKAQDDGNIWNMLGIKSLPIPGLGSAQAVHAAALDMPVPATPGGASPFTPPEQLAPTGGQPTVLPGAPPMPANIPNGQTAAGAPLPLRQNTPHLPMSPEEAARVMSGPAPEITPQTGLLDPNIKNQELARQEQDILMLRQQMDQRLKDLETAEDKMKTMLQQAKDVEDKKVRTLIQMYANMKPRTAAQAMEKMDERIAVRILSGMAPKQSGEILTYTNPSKTAKFTEMITRLRMME